MKSARRTSRRGVIGIESAIVMIAFVIVAAALAFVVLNMGFSTTQKAKTAVASSIGEASSSIEIAGKVTGFGYVSGNVLNATIIPIKIASGGSTINLDPATAAVKYYSSSVSYDNIYGSGCIITGSTYTRAATALDQAVTNTCVDNNPITGGVGTAAAPTKTKAVVYFTVHQQTNSKVLQQGDSAVLAIAYKSGDRPAPLDTLKAEVVLPTGSALTVERNVPSITTNVVDLG